MIETQLFTALSLGFFGSAHCIGMCGGIASALTLNLSEDKRQGLPFAAYQLLYALGRIASYSMIGLIAGSSGWILINAFGSLTTPLLRITAGVMLVLLGLYIGGWLNWISKIEKLGTLIWPHITKLIRALQPVDSPLKAVIIGACWGWLPCGLVYSAVTLALTSGNASQGGLTMLAFGLGTVPAVLTTGVLAQKLQIFLQKTVVRHSLGGLIVIFGLYTILFTASHMSHNHDGHNHDGHPQPKPDSGTQLNNDAPEQRHHHH